MIEQRLPRGGLLEAPGDVGGDVVGCNQDWDRIGWRGA